MVHTVAKNSNKRYRSRPIRTSHEITRWDQGNHKETYAEYRKIEVIDEKLRETRDEWVISIKDKMKQVLRDDATTSWDIFHRSLFQSIVTSNPVTQRHMSSYQDISVVDKRPQQIIHCVTELRDAGIKFMRKETGQLWDIEFKNGYLKIPKLLIHDGTKSLFLNLIAFEQCHTHSSNNITSYIIFMDNLINSSDDVSYLHRHDIIEHWLGSDSEVADLFNRLCKEVVFDPKDG